MPEARKRPCTICRRWFRPNARVGDRQHACGNPECQTVRRQKTQADWRNRNPGYSIAWRIDQRAAVQPEAPEPLRMPPPLHRLPWDVAKDQPTQVDRNVINIARYQDHSLADRVCKAQFVEEIRIAAR